MRQVVDGPKHRFNCMVLNSAQRKALVEAAIAVRAHAHAPYSNFRVGAALMVENAKIFVGCNVENASYGLTICAERAAVCAALSAGYRRWRAIVIASDGGCPPCGACRQVLAEFSDTLPILLVDAAQQNQCKEFDLASLLPHGFAFPFKRPVSE